MCVQSKIVPQFLEPDVYGQRHPIETPELIESSLIAFESEFARIPDREKACALTAIKRCPELLTPKFKLMFLRCEVFNVDLAAKRYANYWEKRVKLFGEEKAYQPLTLKSLMELDGDVAKVLDRRMFHCVNACGRKIGFVEYNQCDPSKYSRLAVVRMTFYLAHVLLEDEETQKRGLVLLIDSKGIAMKNVDTKLSKMNASNLKGALPIRLSAIHIMWVPPFAAAVWAIAKYFLPERLRKRVLFHTGDDTTKIQRLSEKYGLVPAEIPKNIGGEIEVDANGGSEGWLAARKAVECEHI